MLYINLHLNLYYLYLYYLGQEISEECKEQLFSSQRKFDIDISCRS